MHITFRSSRRARIGVAVALASLIGAALAACSSGASTSGGTATITLSMQNSNIKLSDPSTYKIIQEFEKKYPKIKVTASGEPTAQHLQKLSIAAQSHTLPDIFWVYKTTAQDMEKNGDLLNLAPMLDDLGIKDKFPASSLANFTEGSTLYGVPYQGLLTGYFYNTKILSDNGLQPPKTFDDLLNITKTLHAKGITTIAQGASQSSFSVWTFLTDLDRFGYEDKYKDILAGKESFDNPDFLKLYNHIKELADAGAFPSNTATQTFQQAVSSFIAGQAAFLDGGVWLSAQLQGSTIAGDVGFWAGPSYSDGVGEQDIVMNVPSAPFAVSAEVKKDKAKYDAVEKFLGFYYSDQAQQIMADQGQPPVTTYTPNIPSSSTVFQTVLNTAKGKTSPQSQPDLVVSTAVANAMYDSIYGVIEGQTTPKQALDLVQAAIGK